MAATITLAIHAPDTTKSDRLKLLSGSIAMGSSYPSGGESASVNLARYFKLLHHVLIETQAGYTFQYDKTNNKIKAYTGGAEVTATTDLSTLAAIGFLGVGV